MNGVQTTSRGGWDVPVSTDDRSETCAPTDERGIIPRASHLKTQSKIGDVSGTLSSDKNRYLNAVPITVFN